MLRNKKSNREMRSLRECLKGLLRVARPQRSKLFVSCAIGLVRIAASMAFVWVCKALVDIATGTSDRSIGLYVGIMIGIMLVQMISAAAASWWEGMMVTKAQNELRAGLFGHVMKSVWIGRETYHSSDTVNRLEEDIRVMVDMVCSRIPAVVVTLVQLLAASIFLFVLEPSLLFVLLILMPVAVLGSKMFFKTIRKLTAHIRSREGDIQGHMQENLQNRILVKTMDASEAVMDRLGWMQDDVMDHVVRRLNYDAVARSFMRFGFMAGYAAAFLWGIFGIRSGAVTFGMMTAFLQLVGQVQRPIADMSRHIPAFIQCLTSVERLLDLSDLKVEDAGDDIVFASAPGIRLDDVSFTYSDYPAGVVPEPVLQHFSYDFKPGSLTAIVGMTGAGKSTLTRILLSLLKPDSGSVVIYSDEGSAELGAATACNFRYVPQGNSLMSGTVRDNLLLARPSASEDEMREALHVAVADFVLDLPDGLDTVCSEKGSGLSEGQAQRIAIARSLLQRGSIMILDEATSSIDAETERTLLQRMSEKYHGELTILWVTHREAVTGIADAVLRIQ